MGRWGGVNAEAASAHLPAGAYRDAAVLGFVNSIASLDPATAVEWASSVPPGSAPRRTAMIDLVRDWRERDPAAARAFFEKLPANDPARKDLRELLAR